MPSTLRDLVEDLRMIVPIVPLGSMQSPNAVYAQLKMLLAQLTDNPELDNLSTDELKALKMFISVVDLAGTMDPEAMRKHIQAAWLGTSKQAVLKTSLGKQISDVYHELMLGAV